MKSSSVCLIQPAMENGKIKGLWIGKTWHIDEPSENKDFFPLVHCEILSTYISQILDAY